VCCSVLQGVALFCSLLTDVNFDDLFQKVNKDAEIEGVLQCVERCDAVCCSVLQCVALCCSILQCVH